VPTDAAMLSDTARFDSSIATVPSKSASASAVMPVAFATANLAVLRFVRIKAVYDATEAVVVATAAVRTGAVTTPVELVDAAVSVAVVGTLPTYAVTAFLLLKPE